MRPPRLTLLPAPGHAPTDAAPSARLSAARAGLLLASGLGASALACSATLQVLVSDDAGQPLSGAAVFVQSRDARGALRPPAPRDLAVSSQPPAHSVSVVTVGTPLAFSNTDSVAHQLFSRSPAKKFDLKLTAGESVGPMVFDQPGIAAVGCTLHDDIAAWVVVVDTPFHGRTGLDGKLSISAMPTGRYRLRVWHPAMPSGAPALDQALAMTLSGVTQVKLQVPGLAP